MSEDGRVGERALRSPSSALSHPLSGAGEPPTKIDYRKQGILILTSLLEDLDFLLLLKHMFSILPCWFYSELELVFGPDT